MATEAVSGNDDENRKSFNMAASADGSSPDPGPGFLRKVQQFPKHDTVKLSDRNFLLWKQQVMLILEGYGLHEFVLGIVVIPPQNIIDNNGVLTSNPEFLFHKQQDKLLASFISVVPRRVVRHSLYSQKKGSLTVKEYLAKVQSLCNTLLATGNGISEQEQVSIVLVGLPVEYESICVVASAMNVSLDLLVEMLFDYENRQSDLASSLSLQVNLAQQQASTDSSSRQFDRTFGSSSWRRGRFSRDRGRGKRFSQN
ncbi:hypothetical protein PVK06_026483 [Gossypium arboreum]|uniref:Retrovirus-related Pol polyprotein from transposon TNT 1-94 n=1 Tax=Gossypium arboreum TaxID=29729 RepID=A0ABR0NXS5_GOSAR|nr:hypothetical protein PVK06_026483 [Gossypium arboreum]